MHTTLRVSIGQCSDPGRKPVNQDFHGAVVPKEPLATLKGICVALADGISTSSVSQEASEAAVTGFLEDYYCTSEAWSVKSSVERVLGATNSWLHSQTLRSPFRYEKDRGYVCTFAAVVLKSATAHIFHAGDTRVYQLRGDEHERLTRDHRVQVSSEEAYLGRALGAAERIELDYRAVPIARGSTFLLVTDGVYEHVTDAEITELVARHGGDLDAAAKSLVQAALANGSQDNLSAQIVRVDDVGVSPAILQELSELPLPPQLEPRMRFDGYSIVRELHASHRSHVHLALDDATGDHVVLKTPAIDLRQDAALLERFLMEEWIARRIHNPHVLAPYRQTRARNFVYLVTEHIEGQTLAQWMRDHPKPDVEEVRRIVEQIARGLNAFHKLEMLHQDLRPENILIDRSGTARIIDFGSVHVAGLAELTLGAPAEMLGTAQYTAPEYFLGQPGSPRSDLFSLGVITYQMLSGKLPYGAEVPKRRTKLDQQRLVYLSLLADDRDIPAWMDDAIARAVHPDPFKRYAELSAFIFDLRHPSKAFLSRTLPPLIERNPVAFWKGVSAILVLIIFGLLLGMR
jgi:serine/threonine protein phosphatase PrpC